MKWRLGVRGFTVIESMIFLTISSFVFVSAIAGYSQRQKEVQFTQGVRTLQAQLQDVINDVATGFYPTLPANCHASNLDNSAPYFDSNASNASNSSNCVWFGKAIQLGTTYFCNAATTSDNCDRYGIMPIVARRTNIETDGTKKPIDTFAQARPIALASCIINPGVFGGSPCTGTLARPDLSQRGELQGFIGVYRIYVRDANGNNSPARETGAIAFTTALQRNQSSFGRLDKTNTIDMVYIPGTNVSTSEAGITNAIGANFNSNNSDADPNNDENDIINPPNGITLCIKGAQGQRTAIMIGANSRQLDVVIEADMTRNPGC